MDVCEALVWMESCVCDGGSRGVVVVNRTETYFPLTLITNWQPELICVSKRVRTHKDSPFFASTDGCRRSLFSWMANMTTSGDEDTDYSYEGPSFCYFGIITLLFPSLVSRLFLNHHTAPLARLNHLTTKCCLIWFAVDVFKLLMWEFKCL